MKLRVQVSEKRRGLPRGCCVAALWNSVPTFDRSFRLFQEEADGWSQILVLGGGSPEIVSLVASELFACTCGGEDTFSELPSQTTAY